MADKFSFDIVSELNLQEVANAVDQAQRAGYDDAIFLTQDGQVSEAALEVGP